MSTAPTHTTFTTNRPPSRIVCAAMLMDDDHIVLGVRHFSPDMRATLRRLYGTGFKLLGVWVIKPYHLRVIEQGFVDQFGTFHDRKAAWTIAQAAGQIREVVSTPGTLYSECLY